MKVELFNYDLPEELIAQTPLSVRTSSRLLTLDKVNGHLTHQHFEELAQMLKPGDTLVLNNTKVLPARLYGVKRDTLAKVEILLLKALENDQWEALVRPAKRIRVGTIITFGGVDNKPELTAEIIQEKEMGIRILHFRYSGVFHEILEKLGRMPLPPYITAQLEDGSRYQTVFAKHLGSAAAPTAGLHFTDSFLERLEQQGVQVVYVTLHVGLGTFRPVTVDTVTEHTMHSEFYTISKETARAVNETKQQGGRVIAVGTTSARVLETAGSLQPGQAIQAGEGWTDIYIFPGYVFKVVDALITNFHLPKSTLLMMVCALAGREHVLHAYDEAIQARYRFFSFGDAMFIY